VNNLSVSQILIFLGCMSCTQWVAAAVITPASAVSRLQAGQAVDLIVEYDSSSIEQDAASRRELTPKHTDDAAILDRKSSGYKNLKQKIDGAMLSPEVTSLKDYSHLPLSLKHVKSLAALNSLAALPGIKAIYEDGQAHHVLVQSLPLVNQPAVAAVGEKGNGTTVAVIDDGIDYTNATFGSCTAPGSPAGCRVVASVLFGSGTTDTSHGSNVAAVVLGMAPDSRIAMLNAFSGTAASFSAIISGINWAIANQSTYNIVAINMSLGDGTRNTTSCSNGFTNPFVTPVNNAINAGISVVAASGNDTYANALGNPACTPGVISVGAVYDSNFGGITYGALCGDTATAADKVTCFSDSASYLTMLAPGAMVAAAGYTMAGTSQASPHVAGALAVLRSTFPAETMTQSQIRLINSGTPVTDTRNSIVKPRLNLLEAARPANNSFANRALLSGSTGNSSGTDLLANKESGEPAHAGNSGGSSVWWKWTAPAAGQVSLNTHGSGFDTLLAVYTGAGVGALTQVASNDNDGTSGNTSSLLFQAQAGKEYDFAVDGFNGAAGNVLLGWSLNSTAAANLSLNLTGPSSAAAGSAVTYVLTVTNAGPQSATNVVAAMTLPAGASFVSGSAGCSVSGTTVTCHAGNIANGGSVSLSILLVSDSSVTTETLTASVASDLPDPVPSNGTATMQVAIIDNNQNDVPTLPQWGQLLMATLLGGSAILARRKGINN
jgi:uncharacterized repeat protein (TIGR01451 family)